MTLSALMSDNSSTSSYCYDILGGLSLYKGLLISETLIIMIMVIVVGYSFIRTAIILYKLTRNHKNQRDGISGMIRSVGGANK